MLAPDWQNLPCHMARPDSPAPLPPPRCCPRHHPGPCQGAAGRELWGPPNRTPSRSEGKTEAQGGEVCLRAAQQTRARLASHLLDPPRWGMGWGPRVPQRQPSPYPAGNREDHTDPQPDAQSQPLRENLWETLGRSGHACTGQRELPRAGLRAPPPGPASVFPTCKLGMKKGRASHPPGGAGAS